jgi:hypothetical protein
MTEEGEGQEAPAPKKPRPGWGDPSPPPHYEDRAAKPSGEVFDNAPSGQKGGAKKKEKE